MNNFYIQQQKQLHQKNLQLKHKLQKKWQQKQSNFKISSKNAYIDKVHSNLNLITPQILNQGTIPLYNPSNHQFRSRQKNKQIDQTNGIRIKNFLTSKDRAQSQSKRIKSLILQKQQYVDPYRKPFQRTVDPLKQGPPLVFAIKPKLQAERILEEQKKNNALLDYNKIDTKMLYQPSWKTQKKQMWISDTRFDSTCSVKKGWDKFKRYSPEKYLGGFDQTGNISRSNKKIDRRPDFISTVQQNGFKTLLNTNSLRSFKSNNFFRKHIRILDNSNDSDKQNVENIENQNKKLYKLSAKQYKVNGHQKS